MRNKPDIEFGNDIPKSFGNSNSIFLSKMEQDVHRHIMNNQNIQHRKKIRLKYIIPIVIMSVPIILILTILFLYSLPDEPRPQSIRLRASIEDGNDTDSKHGCFFRLKAGNGTNVDPRDYWFMVSVKGYSPRKLNISFREYANDSCSTPFGGDLNSSFDWNEDDMRWTEGEYIGFDMPMDKVNLTVQDGMTYEVIITNPGIFTWRGEFVYRQNGEN